MGLPNEIHPFLVTGNDANQYKIPYSLRFRNDGSNGAKLVRTFQNAGNRKTWTWSVWLKLGRQAQADSFLFAYNSGGGYNRTYHELLNGTITIGDYTTSYVWQVATNQLLRDYSAWYHYVVQFDTTQATASNRVRLYLNGSQITSLATANYPSLNYDAYINQAAEHVIGSIGYANNSGFDGYMAEMHFVDGYAYDPSYFGYTDTLTNQWQPKKYTGAYGINGFYLPFNDATGATSTTIGKDNSTYGMLTAQMNGTSNGIQRGGDLTGIANGKTGTISMWWNFTGASSGTQILWMSRNNSTIGNTLQVIRYSGGAIGFTAANSSGAWIADFNETSNSCAAAGLYHIFISWDLSVSNKAYIYINGVAKTVNFSTFTNDTIQYSVPNHGFGGTLYSPFSPTTPGMLGQAYINYSTFIDPTTSISYFYGGTATPVSLGASGQLPTGSSPIVYLDGDATSILTNRGTGGNFSAYGTLATGTTYTGVGKNINDWTPSGISVTSGVTYDVMRDSPTGYDDGSNIYNRGNYAVLNPLSPTQSSLLNNGNLTWTNSSGSANQGYATLTSLPNGFTYYYEAVLTTIGSGGSSVYTYVGDGNTFYATNGQIYSSGSLQTTVATYTTGDIIGFAGTVGGSTTYYKNGSSVFTGGVCGGGIIVNGFSGTVWNFNFGQRPFSYTPPAGFRALNSYNLTNPSLPLV